MRRPGRIFVLGAALAAGLTAYERFGRAPSAEDLVRLRREHQALAERLQQRLDAEVPPPDAAGSGIVVGVPMRLAERLAQEASDSLLSEMRLTLRDIEVSKTGDVSGHILVGRSLLGSYDIAVHLDEVRAVLRAGKPRLALAGEHVSVVLPVALTKGAGRGRLRFHWDGRGVAGGVCGDFTFEGAIEGTVVPAEHTLKGRLGFAPADETLLVRPEIDELAFVLGIEPSAATWALVDKAIEERGMVCRAALHKADVAEKVRAVVARGFAVTLPPRSLPDMRLPVATVRSVNLDGAPVAVTIEPGRLTLGRTGLWYRAVVSIPSRGRAEGSATSRPSPQ